MPRTRRSAQSAALFLSISLSLCARALPASAQLAITEVMSSASTNLGPDAVTQHSDFFELTNFGTNTLNLTGYRFNDDQGGLAVADATPFEALIIGPGESILFVQRDTTTNEMGFREWWGSGLAANAQIRFYTGNGFSSGGDTVNLWSPSATRDEDFIDSAPFGEATRGFSLTYDPATGAFGILSTNGSPAVYKAAASDDYGSPGSTSGPTPLRITQQPESVLANPGDPVQFTVQIQGKPRGTFQWRRNGVPIQGETGSTLAIASVSTENVGDYSVIVNNGITNLTSQAAELALQSDATPPVFTATPENLMLYVGQFHTFTATASGVPKPTYQWQFQGQNIPGATDPQFLFIPFLPSESGNYSVTARNAVGSVTHAFTITVTAQKPVLAITEAMSTSSTGHADWWELTNLGIYPVSLDGFRYDDESRAIPDAFTFNTDAVMQPGESVIFTEGLTPEAFKEWWGADNLPPNIQILTYSGRGLSSAGDAIHVWNAAATENFDEVASASFSASTPAVSFINGTDPLILSELSVTGLGGAFIAANGGDIGSPGYITNPPPRIRFTHISVGNNGATFTFTTVVGNSYTVQFRNQLDPSAWTPITTLTATTTSTSFTDESVIGIPQRFYRISSSQ